MGCASGDLTSLSDLWVWEGGGMGALLLGVSVSGRSWGLGGRWTGEWGGLVWLEGGGLESGVDVLVGGFGVMKRRIVFKWDL